MRIGRGDLLHGKVIELEKRVGELEENIQALRTVLEVIRDAVVEKT